MSIENPNEGNQSGNGDGNANSQSSNQASQPLEGDLAVIVAGLQKKIDAQSGEINALKSGKDKAVNRVEKSNEEMLEKLGKLLNVDPQKIQEAQRQSVLDDLVAERTGRVQPVSASVGTGANTGVTVELGVIDSALELPSNDSRVTDLKLKFGNDSTAYLREAVKLKSTLSTNPPTPAEQLPPSGSARSSATDNPKAVRLNSLLANPSANRDEIKKLKKELDSVGWN